MAEKGYDVQWSPFFVHVMAVASKRNVRTKVKQKTRQEGNEEIKEKTEQVKYFSRLVP